MNCAHLKKGISIMIVEDENIVALDMRYRLEAFGYTVCPVVTSGDAAVSAAATWKPDLILMDIQLRGSIDGVESARLIHNDTEIPIVFVTAFADDETLERVKASDAYGYIVKPYHERELCIAIEMGLSKHRYEQELRIAKEAAEASDKAKSRFLSNISHELKTPLNSIIGFMDLAAGTGDAEELSEYIYHAARSARKLETKIDSILDYTKLEFGGLAPINSEFELEQFMVDCWMPFTGDADSKGVGARMHIDPNLPKHISGDEGKLKIIVRNLIDNAVKFTDSGHVLLSAERATTDAGSTYLSLRVSDTGSGIPEERLSTAFALFAQIDDSTTRAAEGMGLGLPLAKALADFLQVHLECSSKPGCGTEFSLRVELPSTYQAAWPVPSPGELRHVGLYGKSYHREESSQWTPMLAAGAPDEVPQWIKPGGKPDGSVKRDYHKMVCSALSEAETLGVRRELDTMLAAVSDGFSKENGSSLEKLVKASHDNFSGTGAAACASLALAVSMDLRKGMGAELSSVLAALNKRG